MRFNSFAREATPSSAGASDWHLRLASAAGVVAALTIVLYQGWLMPYFQPFFAGREQFARVVFYALYGALGLTAAVAFGTRPEIRRKVMPFAVVAAITVAATALHPIGLATRACIIAVAMGGATVVLILASGPGILLQLTAAVTALNALLCFVDLLFADGFTSTVGRPAGLAINPNVAAAGILLGAVASYRAVPTRFRARFLVLVAGAIVVTLSRSTMLAAGVAAGVPAAIVWWQRARRGQPLWRRPEGLGSAAVMAIALAAWVAVGSFTNHRLRPVVQATLTASLSFAHAIEDAHQSVALEAHDSHDAHEPVAPPQDTRTGTEPAVVAASAAPEPAASPIAIDDRADASRIAAIDDRLPEEGVRNSISARGLLLERAFLAYRHTGATGIGLDGAQPLAPHNTFVLFALAFGHAGWLIPLAWVALAFYAARDAGDLPVAMAAIGTMVTSHDILLTPSLFLPIAIGIAGMLAREPEPAADDRAGRSVAIGSVAAVVLFAAGCLVIVGSAAPLGVERIGPAQISAHRGAYLAYLPTQTFPGLFVPAPEVEATDGPAFLRDDSHPLTHVDFRPWNYPLVSPGEYAVRDGSLVFAPADGTDPRHSGHVVELGLPHTVGPPFYALLLTLSAWSAGVVVLLGRGGQAGRSMPVVQEALY
jgi:hypothetical protein